MPSLSDALTSLSTHSSQLTHLASLNGRPAGPFTHAYLYEPTIPNLIRDANDSETRLFKFVGQTDAAGGAKRVEKREGVVTPLRELRGKPRGGNSEGREGKEDVEAMLRVALKLVDD